MGSRELVVGLPERKSLETSASVRGRRMNMFSLLYSGFWLLNVQSEELTTDGLRHVSEKNSKIIS